MQSPADPANKQRRQPLVFVLVAIWLLFSTAGLCALMQYAQTPGDVAGPPDRWPSQTALQRNEAGKTLVMFAHPHCPCTRASLSELERIVAESGGTIQTFVVFFKPRAAEENWEQTDLWRSAAAIPGVVVSSDLDGAEARRFHATTSGHTAVFDADGNLVFSGGITGARGHEGDNAGHDAVITLLTGGSPDFRETPVFGCPIAEPSNSRGETP